MESAIVLFAENIERNDDSVLKPGESIYEWVNRSPDAEQARRLLSHWFDVFPDDEKHSLSTTTSSGSDCQFFGTVLELFLHAVFSKLGYGIETLAPEDGRSDPDLILTKANKRVAVVEATTVSISPKIIAEDRIIFDFCERLRKQLNSSNYQVIITNAVKGNAELPVRRFAQYLREQADTLCKIAYPGEHEWSADKSGGAITFRICALDIKGQNPEHILQDHSRPACETGRMPLIKKAIIHKTRQHRNNPELRNLPRIVAVAPRDDWGSLSAMEMEAICFGRTNGLWTKIRNGRPRDYPAGVVFVSNCDPLRLPNAKLHLFECPHSSGEELLDLWPFDKTNAPAPNYTLVRESGISIRESGICNP